MEMKSLNCFGGAEGCCWSLMKMSLEDEQMARDHQPKKRLKRSELPAFANKN